MRTRTPSTTEIQTGKTVIVEASSAKIKITPKITITTIGTTTNTISMKTTLTTIGADMEVATAPEAVAVG